MKAEDDEKNYGSIRAEIGKLQKDEATLNDLLGELENIEDITAGAARKDLKPARKSLVFLLKEGLDDGNLSLPEKVKRLGKSKIVETGESAGTIVPGMVDTAPYNMADEVRAYATATANLHLKFERIKRALSNIEEAIPAIDKPEESEPAEEEALPKEQPQV